MLVGLVVVVLVVELVVVVPFWLRFQWAFELVRKEG